MSKPGRLSLPVAGGEEEEVRVLGVELELRGRQRRGSAGVHGGSFEPVEDAVGEGLCGWGGGGWEVASAAVWDRVRMAGICPTAADTELRAPT